MIYSGADLLRTAAQQQEKLTRLEMGPQAVKAVESAGQPKSSLDEDTRGALLRFARFVNDKDKKSRPKKRSKGVSKSHKLGPYLNPLPTLQRHLETGLTLDIYI
ncbi:MAG: hypothetical protein AB7H97_22605 [Pseudobdellovibrionaceae bacterium]